MSVGSVSDLAQMNYINSMLVSQRTTLNTLQDQISSGEKASLYSGLGGSGTVSSISLNNSLSQLDMFSNNISEVQGKTSVMAGALTNMTSTVQSVVSDLLTVTQQSTDPGMANFNVEAQSALNQIQSYLNSAYNGQYVFAGTDWNNQPVNNIAGLNANVSAQLANLYSGAATGSTVLTNIQALSGTSLGYSATVGGAGHVTAQIDTNQTVDYTVKADDPSIQGLMQGLATIANLKYDPNHPSDFWTVYNGALKQIQQGATGVTTLNAQVGTIQQELTNATNTQQDVQTTLQTQLGNVDDVDVAQATTQLQLMQTQLQASYKVISEVSSLSLVSYLGA
jgi:flagellar hook-associated protein 3 FlgL